MQSLHERLATARNSILNMDVKFKMPLIVRLDYAATIREQCAFLKALVACSQTAKDEYAFVLGELNKLDAVRQEISNLKERIESVAVPALDDDEDISSGTEDKLASTRRKLYNFAERLDNSISQVKKNTEKLGEDLKSFKVVLFGRTKAGKSTVREALTQGTGETIGKGRQSTTKEIQWYDWQNLKVFDTPGILSTNDTNRGKTGVGDEESKALELLQQADVAIFMFASDNIETAELDYLRAIVNRGKNVLALLNVKADITDYKAFLLRRKEQSISVKMQAGHVNRIMQAVPGHALAIIPIHAQAAFFSRAEKNAEVDAFFERYADDGVTRTSVYELSQFGEIRKYLSNNILKQGRAIRCQQIREYFINCIERFAGSFIEDTQRLVDSWQQYREKTNASKARITMKAARFKESIREKIAASAKADPDLDTYSIASRAIEHGWSKDEIKETWRLSLERGMPKIPGPIIETFVSDIKDEIEELMNGFDFIRDTYITDDDTAYVLPWSDMFKIGGFVAGCLSFAATVGWIPGGGWVAGGLAALAAVLAVVANLFKSKTTKTRELKEKLDESLNRCIDEMAKSVRGQCENKLFPGIFGKYEEMLALQTKMIDVSGCLLAENQKLLDLASRNREKMEMRVREIGG